VASKLYEVEKLILSAAASETLQATYLDMMYGSIAAEIVALALGSTPQKVKGKKHIVPSNSSTLMKVYR
jgi:hypothetical protein